MWYYIRRNPVSDPISSEQIIGIAAMDYPLKEGCRATV